MELKDKSFKNMKELAKSAIRDIFIQMPTRTVSLDNWNGYKNFIIGNFGEKEYKSAMKELFKDKWIKKESDVLRWKTVYPKKLNENIVKESPDGIKDDRGEYFCIWDDDDAIAFGEYKDYMFVIQSTTHSKLRDELYDANLLDKKDIRKNGRQIFKYPGRIWTDKKIISFWKYPENNSKLKDLCKKIEDSVKKRYNRDIGNIYNTYNIEVVTGKSGKIKKNVDAFSRKNERLIPCAEYFASKAHDDQGQMHVQSPVAKFGMREIPPKKPESLRMIARKLYPWGDGIIKQGNVIDEKYETHKNEYGCLMLKLPIKNWTKMTNLLKKEDLYDKPEYGIELEPHCTILYGFHEIPNLVNILKKVLHKLIKSPIQISLTGISLFQNEKFDVLKFDVESSILNKLNKLFREKFPYTNSYSKYFPHITIAYLKPGTGEKYIKLFSKNPIFISSNIFEFSSADGKKTSIEV